MVNAQHFELSKVLCETVNKDETRVETLLLYKVKYNIIRQSFFIIKVKYLMHHIKI